MMAILPPLTALDIDKYMLDEGKFYAVKGMPVVVNYIMSKSDIKCPLSDTEIKIRLCQMIAEELFKQKLIECTKEYNNVTGDTRYRARMFAVPNTDVQLLREKKII